MWVLGEPGGGMGCCHAGFWESQGEGWGAATLGFGGAGARDGVLPCRVLGEPGRGMGCCHAGPEQCTDPALCTCLQPRSLSLALQNETCPAGSQSPAGLRHSRCRQHFQSHCLLGIKTEQ